MASASGLRRITLHECRHTFASLMIAAGVNAKALSAYMGHANISITMDRYGHLMPGQRGRGGRACSTPTCSEIAPGARQNGNGRGPGGPAPNAPRSPAEALARLVTARRRALGLSQHELAVRVQATASQISRIESGREVPSIEVLGLLAGGV